MAVADTQTPTRAPGGELARPRTYGAWRRPASAGLLGLGSLSTAVLLVGLVLVIAAMMVLGWLEAMILALLLAVVLASLLVKDRHGTTGLARAGLAAGWWAARRTGANVYRSGPLGHTPWGTFQLPGLLAASRLSEWVDSYGRPFALVHLPATGDHTVVIATEPDGASLVDPGQVDSWVAHWAGWLTALGDEPGLVGASVTVESAPDTGARLRAEVEAHVDPHAPAAAQAMLAEAVRTYPVGSATVRAWVALTFSATTRPGGRRRESSEVARDLATRLPGLTAGLHATGAGPARPVGAQDLCEVVRVAYDPHAASLLEAAREAGETPALSWADVGPAGAQADWGTYRHDEATSVTWSMTAAPRGEVYSSVLAQLLAPHPDVDRKRVTLAYRPLDSARSARIVEADKRSADFRLTSATRPTARAVAESRAADQAAREEARGAGLVNFALLVTATVLDDRRLADARAAVDTLSATARVQLRVVHGSQDSAFAAALPLGLVLPRHLRVPTEIRESL